MVSARASMVQPLVADLQRIFGERLEAVVAYGWRQSPPVPTLALVRDLSVDDLQACAGRAGAWHRQGIATPLLLTASDFARSLDVFPIEYGEIIQHHDVAFGHDPFAGLSISREDLRRACEVQVKSHLLHLREDYVESGGRQGEVDAIVRESAPAFMALLRQLARLDDFPADGTGALVEFAHARAGLDRHTVGDVLSLAAAEGMSSVDPVKLLPPYLSVMERLAEFVDRWREG
jgi:hypothetical protein